MEVLGETVDVTYLFYILLLAVNMLTMNLCLPLVVGVKSLLSVLMWKCLLTVVINVSYFGELDKVCDDVFQ